MSKKRKKTGSKKKKKQVSKKASKGSSEKQRKVSHAGARQKGLAFEREVANELGHIFPEAKRHLESQASEAQGFDISSTGPYKIQCKNHQNYTPIGKIREVQAKKNDVPVLVTKGNKLKAVAVMYFDDWVDLLELAHGNVNMPIIEDTPTDTFKSISYDIEKKKLIERDYHIGENLLGRIDYIPPPKNITAPEGESKYDTEKKKLIERDVKYHVDDDLPSNEMYWIRKDDTHQQYDDEAVICNVCDHAIGMNGLCACPLKTVSAGLKDFI